MFFSEEEFYQIEEEKRSELATPRDACDEYARNFGMDNTEHAWILTPFDSWEANPFYRGPAVRHPEDDPCHACENFDCTCTTTDQEDTT